MKYQMKYKITKLLFLISILLTQNAFCYLPFEDENGKPLPSLSKMLKKTSPAVVNISTFSIQQQLSNPLLNDPFFKRFFNIPDTPEFQQQPLEKRQQSAGSGVIVNANEGIIITNYHVIKNVEEVHVSLIDGRAYDAKVIGTDPDLDIAVLKIDSEGLTEIQLADSHRLEVGDFVVAIGNPFGLGQTVTTGVVSALSRNGLGIEDYENFIQTDASINPGNSGGALVNLNGDLVGINTAIIAPSGGNIGIGFAIPINMAKASMEQILLHGEVKRGEIGIGIQNLTGDLRKAFNLKNGESGVLVTQIVEGSPAEKAGLKSGDIILEVDEKKTKSTGHLRSMIGMKNIGQKVRLKILRETKEKDIIVKIGEPKYSALIDSDMHPLLKGAQFENYAKGEGVQVINLKPNSKAAYSGLNIGDIIIAVNKQPISDLKTFKKALKSDKKSVLLHINRSGISLFIYIK